MKKTIYCTTAAARTLPQALLLRDSLRAQGVEDLRILVTEHPAIVAKLRAQLPDLTLLAPNQIGCAQWLHLAFSGSAAELGAALKPALLATLLTEGSVVYLAPTIEVLSPLSDIEQALTTADFVVTPRVSRPLPDDGKSPSMRDVLRAGPFDLDFIGVRAGEQNVALLRWWQQATSESVMTLRDGEPLQNDASWASVLPSLCDTLRVLRSPRFLLSAWNLAQNSIAGSGDQGPGQTAPQTADGPLVLLSYAGLSEEPAAGAPLQAQNRFEITQGSPIQKLLARRQARIAASQLPPWTDISGSFLRYTDGTPIPDSAREIFLRLAPQNRRVILNPFTDRRFFEEIAARSPAVQHISLQDTLERCAALERRMNTLPYSLFSHAANALDLALPGSRDQVYNLMQNISRGYGGAVGQTVQSLKNRVQRRS